MFAQGRMRKNYLSKAMSNLEIIFRKVRGLEHKYHTWFFLNIRNFALQGMRKGNISNSSALKIIFWHTLALDLKYKQWIRIKFLIFNFLSPLPGKDGILIWRIGSIWQMNFLYNITWKRSLSLLKKYINLMWYSYFGALHIAN